MNKFLILGLAGLLSGCATLARLSGKPRWSDEFAGPAGSPPDPGKWVHDSGNGENGWGNQELEHYCSPGEGAPCDPKRLSARLDGEGRLVIEALRSSSGTWTSARLKTQGLAKFQYGRVEARIKLPVGAGLWPAFWMLGYEFPKVRWPACGEIDMMENVPELGPARIRSTIHGEGFSGGNGVRGDFVLPAGTRIDDGFHTYGVSWSPGRLAFYVDDPGKPFFIATPESIPPGTKWIGERPYFLILNLAVGGGWPKSPDETTPSPARMIVDWVRVY